MRLQEKFTEQQYNDCIKKIKRREYFEIRVENKGFNFILRHEFCDNGIWKGNRYVGVDMYSRNGGYSYGMQIDEIESYAEICYSFNRMVKAEELEQSGVEHQKIIKLSTIVVVEKMLKDNADKFLIRDLLLDTTITEREQDEIVSIIESGSTDAFCKGICAELKALGYKVEL